MPQYGGNLVCSFWLHKSNHLYTALYLDSQLLKCFTQNTLGFCLRDKKEVVIATVDVREVLTEDALPATIDAGCKTWMTSLYQLSSQPSLLQQFQRTCLNADRPRCRCWLMSLLYDAYLDAKASKFEGYPHTICMQIPHAERFLMARLAPYPS